NFNYYIILSLIFTSSHDDDDSESIERLDVAADDVLGDENGIDSKLFYKRQPFQALTVAVAEAVKRRRIIQKKGGVTGGGGEKTGLGLANNKKDVFVARCRHCRRCVRIIPEPEQNGMGLSNKKDENLSVVNKHGFESGIAALDTGVFAWETTLYT
ncbi:hypothetical protein C5167_032954, partial [Papaver somniferum]